MANVASLTDTDFQTKIDNASVPVLVDFSATWCGPCKALAPTIDTVAAEYQGKLDVYTVDVDQASETAGQFGVRSVPTCIIFQGGAEVDRFMGNVDLRSIKQRLDKFVA